MKSFARLDTEGQGWRRGIYEAEMSGCLWSSNTNVRYRRRQFSQDFTDTQSSARAFCVDEDSKAYKGECKISSEQIKGEIQNNKAPAVCGPNAQNESQGKAKCHFGEWN